MTSITEATSFRQSGAEGGTGPRPSGLADLQASLRLSPELLYTACDPQSLPGLGDADLQLVGSPGQQRAAEAIDFGVGIRRRGYNIYALGPTGTGRHSLVLAKLRQQAQSKPTPDDWCYVNNFSDSRRPTVLRLPTGKAAQLRDAMRRLVDELRAALPDAFERDDHRGRREALDQQLNEKRDAAFSELGKKAEQKNAALVRTPLGITIVPIRNGKPIPTEVFQRLPEAQQEAIRKVLAELQEELEQIVRQIPDWERQHRDAVRELNRETAGKVIDHALREVRSGFEGLPAVLDYFAAVDRDLRDRVDDFLAAGKVQPDQRREDANSIEDIETGAFRRYRVNIMVRHDSGTGAPVIYEDHPTYQRLVGRVEHLAHQGALLTDFNLIVPGALHQANGGYLVIDAERLLANPFGWDALKRALQAEQVRIESVEQLLSVASTISLEPDTIPLTVTVVLIGPPLIYYLLSMLDADFDALFKIAAEFEPDVVRDEETVGQYARLLAALAKRDHLRPLDPSGAARIIEHASRLAGNARRLSTNIRTAGDLLQEADFIAERNGAPAITAIEVQAAIDARIRRTDRLPRRLQDEIGRRTLRIETVGVSVGQVNGLSVISLGAAAFGHPSRITAQVRIGRGEVVDIEREVKLGGSLHSKGVMILSGFLGGRFGGKSRLSLGASLVFEQSYGHVEGDSASAAELLALLSALADVPLRQSLAVTGSVDQHGNIQAVGGINEKIEGFYDACRAQGWTKSQGVVIPAANVDQLMLRHDVVEAVRAGEFHVFAIDTIDQGIELLGGLPAGRADETGNYPPETVNQRIAARLAAFAKAAADAGGGGMALNAEQ